MKLKFLIIITSFLALSSCSKKAHTSKTFGDDTAHHQRIAVIPIDTELNLRPKQREQLTDQQFNDLVLAQSKEVQDAIESYLVSRKLRVRIQSSSMTNRMLKENGINLLRIGEQDVTRLAKILNVDAVVGGHIEIDQPMSEELATGLNVAKSLERNLAGTFFGSGIKTTTNRGQCRLSLFEAKTGDRLWSFSDDIDMGTGSNTSDVISKLMMKGAKKFPYRK